MLPDESTIESRLSRAAGGDPAAADELLASQRERLRRMIAARLDTRLLPRVDPSDIVQETMLKASRKLPEFLQQRPLPFFCWLRRLALDQLVDLYRRHVIAQRRSLLREEHLPLPDESALQLAQRLFSPDPNPSTQSIRSEQGAQLSTALGELEAADREILIMRYVEQLTTAEMAAILGTSERTVQLRHRRGLERLHNLLSKIQRGE
jgi:RNA polymerase sigma-70 factor (ECF subfamily)